MEVESNRDRARLLDPCGMLDKAALVAEVGTPLDIGPDIQPVRCRVVFDRSATVNEVVVVDVQLSVTEDGTGELFRIGERTASVLQGGNQPSTVAQPLIRDEVPWEIQTVPA